MKTARLRRLVKESPLGPIARRAVALYRSRTGGSSSTLGDRYDREIVNVMERVLRRDSNCVDAGANHGKFLREMVRIAPAGRHYAFEPLPHLVARLKQEFPDVRVMEMALSDVIDTAKFRHVLNADAFSGFERRPWDSYEEAVDIIEVRVTRLDDELPTDLPVRFIKVDVEGSEYRLFQGAQRTLREHKPFVAFELGSHQPEIFDLLTSCGLAVSLLERWLSGRDALTRARFLEEVHSLRHWTFLAYSLR